MISIEDGGQADGARAGAGVPDDVGEPLAHDPAEQLLVGGVDVVHGTGQVGGDARRPQQLPPGGELPGERHLAVAGHGGAHLGERLPGQGLHLGHLLDRAGLIGLRRAGRPGRPSP